jgi:opacity protein-like surface antigen
MKKVLGACLALVSLSVFATDRNVWDLQYLPKAKTLYGQTSLTYGSGESEGSDSLDVDISGWKVSQAVGFSFLDNLLVSARIKNSGTTYEYNGETDAKSHYNGWSDPMVDARFRVMDESLIFDVVAGGVVSTGSAYYSQNGNNNAKGENDLDFQGGSQLFIGAQIGQKLSNMQYSFLGQLEHFLESDSRYQNMAKDENDAHTNWNFEGSLLNILMENKLFLHSFLGVRFVQKFDVTDKADDSTYSTAPITEYRLGTGIDYAVTNDILANVGVAYRQLNMNSGTVDDFHVWLWTVGARYQF